MARVQASINQMTLAGTHALEGRFPRGGKPMEILCVGLLPPHENHENYTKFCYLR